MEQSKLNHLAKVFADTLGGKKAGHWKIFFNGEPVTTTSGKTSWAQAGHAKNALYAHVANSIFYWWKRDAPSLYYFGKRAASLGDTDLEKCVLLEGNTSGKELSEILMEAGVVEIVNMDERKTWKH